MEKELDEIGVLVKRFRERYPDKDWDSFEKKERERAQYSALYCRHCAGIEVAYYDGKEISVNEASRRGFVAVDAGCIC